MWQDGLRLNAPGMTQKAGESFWQHIDSAKSENKKVKKETSQKNVDSKATEEMPMTAVEEAGAAQMDMLKDITEARKLSVVAGSGQYTKQLAQDLVRHAVLVESMYQDLQQLLKDNPEGTKETFKKILAKWEKAQAMFKDQKDSAKKFSPKAAKAKAKPKAKGAAKAAAAGA